MARKKVERKVTEDPRYHNTWKLLKKYRDVVWSLELSVQQVRTQFQIEYDTSIEDFLESIYLAGADLGGTDIEHQARCIERSHKMLTLVQNAVIRPLISIRPRYFGNAYSGFDTAVIRRLCVQRFMLCV